MSYYPKDYSRCSMCDEWYPPSDAAIHMHPEPQSGQIRDALMEYCRDNPGAGYAGWIVDTPEGREWDSEKRK